MKNNDQVSSLKKKKEGLLRRLFGVKRQAKKEEEERQYKAEIERLQAEISSVEDEILKGQVETAKEKIAGYEKEALDLQTRKKTLLEEIKKIDSRFFEISKAAEEAVPKKRIQTSSKHWVTLTRTIKIPRLVFNPFGPPDKQFDDKIEEETVPAIPKNLEHAFSEGWALKEGEAMPEKEELTPGNSREVPIFSLPAVFHDFELSGRTFIF